MKTKCTFSHGIGINLWYFWANFCSAESNTIKRNQLICMETSVIWKIWPDDDHLSIFRPIADRQLDRHICPPWFGRKIFAADFKENRQWIVAVGGGHCQQRRHFWYLTGHKKWNNSYILWWISYISMRIAVIFSSSNLAKKTNNNCKSTTIMNSLKNQDPTHTFATVSGHNGNSVPNYNIWKQKCYNWMKDQMPQCYTAALK